MASRSRRRARRPDHDASGLRGLPGFDVTVRTLNPIEGGEERIIEGAPGATTTDVVINVKGRMVKTPGTSWGERWWLPPARRLGSSSV